jgi:HPr kinase/phosphorylase
MTTDKKFKILKEIFAKGLPAIIISRGLTYPKELVIAAKDANIAILRSPLATSRLVEVITNFLDERLAKRISIHGVLMDVYGLGILLQGKSGIGKSETALELIKKGHRLIADDRVDVYQKDELTLIGEAPEILKHFLEIRGIGIIDVMNLFGTSSVRKAMQIQLVIHLEQWTKDKNYDRLGSETTMISIFDVNVAQIHIPVKTGRNLSTIIEVAAMNFCANTMGFDATKKFEQNLTQLIQENSTKNSTHKN